MSETITVSSAARGRIWVFDVDLAPGEVKAFTRRNGSWPLQEALGAEIVAPEHAEVIAVEDLEGVGITGYLEAGMGVPAEQLDDMRARLDRLKGAVLVLSAKAFSAEGARLTPRHPLRLVGSFSEEEADMSFEPLRSEAATTPNTPPKSEAPDAPGQKNTAGIAMAVLLGLTLIGFLLLVWARF